MGPQEPNWLLQPTKESSATLGVAGLTHQKGGYPNTPALRSARKRTKQQSQVEECSQPFSGQDKIVDIMGFSGYVDALVHSHPKRGRKMRPVMIQTR